MSDIDPNDPDFVLCDIVTSERHPTFGVSDVGHRFIASFEIRLETESGIIVGKMIGDLVNCCRIDGDELFEVCDADSAGLSEACLALFPKGSDELHIEINPNHNSVGRFLFIHQWAFLPCVSAMNRMVLLHLLGDHILQHDDVIVAWETLANLEPAQLSELGFARISGTGMVFAHLSIVNEFSGVYDDEDEQYHILVNPPATAREDFEALWKSTVEN